jgi:hypothetical protein
MSLALTIPDEVAKEAMLGILCLDMTVENR